MGSLISLGIENLEVDWGKNHNFVNHSKLFLPTDISNSEYYYADSIIEIKPAFKRSLKSIKKRLNLLGYTIDRCAKQYNDLLSELPGYSSDINITFDELQQILFAVNIEKFRMREDIEDFDLGEYVTKSIFENPEFEKVSSKLKSMTNFDGSFLENIDPNIILRLLAENPINLKYEVIWRFMDIVEGGWVEEKDFYEGLAQSDKILIVTEGSSDSKIIKKALSKLHPDVVDFFQFIDMTDNYPFTGTGNVFKFSQGLAHIGILNRIIVLLDNDTAGISTFNKIKKLKLPGRMSVTTLPNLNEANSFKTIGPSGITSENINGKAVSIELFLDLNLNKNNEPIIRWTSYDSVSKAYQGELVSKEKYTKLFFDKFDKDPYYDRSKLNLLLEHLIEIASET